MGSGTNVTAAAVRRRDALDRELERFSDAEAIPGLVALASLNGIPLYAAARGYRDISRRVVMTMDTVFWIASLTKPVTTTAAMQLVEQGRLDLDRPAAVILPELASPLVLEGFDAAGAPRLRPSRRPITLRHLLTHTAGITYDTWNANTARYVAYAGLPGLFTCSNDSLRTPLAFDPGERWQYGAATDWVGKMVEAVSGKRLDAYFRDHILAPLGMNDTSFRLGPAQRKRLAAMHQRQADSSLAVIDFEVPQNPEFFMGGGGLYSTAADYLRFAGVFAGARGGAGILKPETIAEMGRNQIGDLNVVRLESQNPDGACDADFFPGMVKKWGFGFMLNTTAAPTGRSAGSLAWAGAANEYFWIDPARRVAGALLMQYFPFCDHAALAAFSAFETGVYGLIKEG